MPDIETTGRPPASDHDDLGGDRGNGEGARAGALATDDRRPSSRGRLTYNPALDGIRGIAVLAVLFFHGGFSWARGGYLGVSTFFTLSGFLITSLLVREQLDTGRVRLGSFWARRVRRLFPASALTLAVISLSALVVDEAWERSLRGDVLAALAQVVNWRFILDDRSYADLFASPSPVLHFWSLAIEEQFYWLFPLLAVGVLAVAKGSLRVLAVVVAALSAGSAVVTFAIGADHRTAIYYATPVRVGEILVGAMLAIVVARRPRPLGAAPARAALAAAGLAALVASVWAWSNVDQTSPRLYQGGLLAYAVVSGVLVLSATVAGPVRSLMSVEPLRLIGVVSYGVYLFHWPIFLLVDEERTNRSGWPLFAIRLALTLAAAAASYILLERPIRNGWRPRRPRVPMPALACGTLVAVAVVAVAVPLASQPPPDPFEELTAGDPDPSEIPPSAALGIAVGDSTMLMTAWGLSTWGDQTDQLRLLGADAGGLGCGLARGGDRISRGVVGTTSDECNAWADRLPRSIAARLERYGRLDFVVIQTGPWDVTDRRLPGDDTWRAPGDPVYDDYLRSELGELTDLVLDQGVRVVWLTAPHIEVGKEEEPRPADPYPESDPARIDRLNEIIRGVVASRSNAVVVDLAAYVDALPPELDDRVRPDGVHFDIDQTASVAGDWLGPALVDAASGEPIPAIPSVPLSGVTAAAGAGG
jgi:peptidoglycan/LPS O-acetylase OafA/YrhL